MSSFDNKDSSDSRHTENFLTQALEQARLAEAQGEVPVGAVVVRSGPQGDEVVARAHNLRERDFDPTAHAEILVLRAAGAKVSNWRLAGCTLYVTLEPCLMCLTAAMHSRVDRVIYGAADPKGGAISLGFQIQSDPRFNHRFEIVHEPSIECGAILTEFFRRKRGS